MLVPTVFTKNLKFSIPCQDKTVSIYRLVTITTSNRILIIDFTCKMVCDKCEKKLGKVITPDPWKAGARNTTEGGGRKVGENKALTAKKARFNPYTNKFQECKICRTKVHQVGSHYCQACAYKKGICAMCGKKILDTKNYRQSST